MKRKGPTCGRGRKVEGPECIIARGVGIEIPSCSPTKPQAWHSSPPSPCCCSTSGRRRAVPPSLLLPRAPDLLLPLLHVAGQQLQPISSSTSTASCSSSMIRQAAELLPFSGEEQVTPASTKNNLSFFPFSNLCCSFTLG